MSYYYAFCSIHKKLGPRRSSKTAAQNDAIDHRRNGCDGYLSVKHGNISVKNGKKYYAYKLYDLEE